MIMKIIRRHLWLIAFLLLSVSCSDKTEGAKKQLEFARQLYAEGYYDSAKHQIDSIKILYPKAYDQIKSGLALLDSVRRGQNATNIAFCDSIIKAFQPKIDSVKKYFVYQRDKNYQDAGFFIPREIASGGVLTGTTIRTGVAEDGYMYIESIFVGGNQRHNKIKVSAKDGSFAESLPVTDDGLNFRFSNMGKQFEVIKFTKASDNGVGRFIFANAGKPLTITLDGAAKYSYTLSQPLKNAVVKSFQLSQMMLQMDSLKTEREKSEFKNYYLDNKEEYKASKKVLLPDSLNNESTKM